MRGLDGLPHFERGGFYILDKGYLDYGRLHYIARSGAFFVTRPKENARFQRRYSAPADKTKGVLCDQTVLLTGFYVRKDYPDVLRRIKFYDSEQGRVLVFITNNFELEATDIAALYKHRWSVELFFKWIKQHLRVNSFWGTSINAVKTQVYTAVITYCLISMVRDKLGLSRSAYEILQILSVSLLDKTPINSLLQPAKSQNEEEPSSNSLQISLF